MNRFVISPDLLYLIAVFFCAFSARQFPQLGAIGFCFFLFMWMKEQLSLIGCRTIESKSFALSEALLRAGLFFRRIEARIPIPYFTKLLIADLDAMSRTLYEQQRYDEAMKFTDEAIEAAIERYGQDSVDHIAQLINKGILLNLAGRGEESESLTGAAVTRLESIKHSLSKMQAENLCLALNNLGACYIDQRKIEKALDAFDRSVSLKAEILGAGSQSIAVSYGNQGYSMLKAGKYESAEAYLRRALKLVEGARVDPSLMATFLNNLGDAMRGQGRLNEAEAELLKALDMRKGSLNSQHPHLGYSYHNLGQLYADKGSTERADSYFKQAIEIRKIHPGPAETELKETMAAYNAFLQKNGKGIPAVAEVKPQKAVVVAPGWVKPVSVLFGVSVMVLPIVCYISGMALQLVSKH